MKVYGYGEDALTLWAIHNKLPSILSQLDDESTAESCTVFFRPSFGRRGGDDSAQFGEFGFILLTAQGLYLGEAKWDRSPEKSKGEEIHLRPEQLTRHAVFHQYVKEWTCGTYATWDDFVSASSLSWSMGKPMAPSGSLLSENLQNVLRTIHKKYTGTPKIEDVLLYIYDGNNPDPIPVVASKGFRLVAVDYS